LNCLVNIFQLQYKIFHLCFIWYLCTTYLYHILFHIIKRVMSWIRLRPILVRFGFDPRLENRRGDTMDTLEISRIMLQTKISWSSSSDPMLEDHSNGHTYPSRTTYWVKAWHPKTYLSPMHTHAYHWFS